MDRTELYLKTAFCCMACDGEIATEEVDIIKKHPLFANAECLAKIDEYTEQLKKDGAHFLKHFLDELKASNLTEEEECQLVKIAVQIIEADRAIEYYEIAFFKKIRSRLKASDEVLLTAIPENPNVANQISPEDYLMPDLEEDDDFAIWDNYSIKNIALQ